MYSPLETMFKAYPRAIVAVDPDDAHTALCRAVLVAPARYRIAELVGGGTGRSAVPWGSIAGALTWLRERSGDAAGADAPTTLVIEAQMASGAHSGSVEGCRRARWHWDAAGEVLGLERVHLLPSDWESVFVAPGSAWRLSTASVKAAYRKRAREIDPRATNEDRAAAAGLAWAYCLRIGATLIGGEDARGS